MTGPSVGSNRGQVSLSGNVTGIAASNGSLQGTEQRSTGTDSDSVNGKRQFALIGTGTFGVDSNQSVSTSIFGQSSNLTSNNQITGTNATISNVDENQFATQTKDGLSLVGASLTNTADIPLDGSGSVDFNSKLSLNQNGVDQITKERPMHFGGKPVTFKNRPFRNSGPRFYYTRRDKNSVEFTLEGRSSGDANTRYQLHGIYKLNKQNQAIAQVTGQAIKRTRDKQSVWKTDSLFSAAQKDALPTAATATNPVIPTDDEALNTDALDDNNDNSDATTLSSSKNGIQNPAPSLLSGFQSFISNIWQKATGSLQGFVGFSFNGKGDSPLPPRSLQALSSSDNAADDDTDLSDD